jgi:hypothetical protein
MVGAHHPDWFGGGAVIATSEDVQLGIQTNEVKVDAGSLTDILR